MSVSQRVNVDAPADRTPEDLVEITDPDEVHPLIVKAGLLRGNAMRVKITLMTNRRHGFPHLSLAHNYGQMYEASTVRSLMGIHGLWRRCYRTDGTHVRLSAPASDHQNIEKALACAAYPTILVLPGGRAVSGSVSTGSSTPAMTARASRSSCTSFM